MADGILNRIGSGFDRYIGGLLGEDLSGLSKEEKAQARRQAIGIISRGMLSPDQGSAALTNVMAARKAKRDAPEIARRQADAEAMLPRITGRLFGGMPTPTMPEGGEDELTGVNVQSRYRQDPADAMRLLTATQAGRDVAAGMPDLAKLAQEGLTGRVVGGSIQNPLTGAFSKPPEEKKPKTRVGSEDLGNKVRVYFSDGTTEDLNKGLAPARGEGGLLGAGGVKPTKGQESVDKNFSETINDYVAAGGYADIDKQINQLDDVITALESGQRISGPIIASIMESFPNMAAGAFPEAVNAKDLVEEVAQRNLRAILGGQFAQQEAKELIRRTYNPALREEQNAERLRSLVTQMRRANIAKRDAIEYWNKYGTLAGYTGNLPQIESTVKAPAPKVGAIVEKDGKKYEFLGGDPSKPSSWRAR
jgi:hypothetical protein